MLEQTRRDWELNLAYDFTRAVSRYVTETARDAVLDKNEVARLRMAQRASFDALKISWIGSDVDVRASALTIANSWALAAQRSLSPDILDRITSRYRDCFSDASTPYVDALENAAPAMVAVMKRELAIKGRFFIHG